MWRKFSLWQPCPRRSDHLASAAQSTLTGECTTSRLAALVRLDCQRPSLKRGTAQTAPVPEPDYNLLEIHKRRAFINTCKFSAQHAIAAFPHSPTARRKPITVSPTDAHRRRCSTYGKRNRHTCPSVVEIEQPLGLSVLRSILTESQGMCGRR